MSKDLPDHVLNVYFAATQTCRVCTDLWMAMMMMMMMMIHANVCESDGFLQLPLFSYILMTCHLVEITLGKLLHQLGSHLYTYLPYQHL